MRCNCCGYEYPADVSLSPVSMGMRSGGVIRTERVCGICALVISNQAMGVERKAFDGQVAEQMRQRALAARASGRATRT